MCDPVVGSQYDDDIAGRAKFTPSRLRKRVVSPFTRAGMHPPRITDSGTSPWFGPQRLYPS